MTFNVGMGGNSKSANLNKALGNSAKLTAQQQLAQKETNVNNIVNQFNEGKINRTTAISQLTALGVQSSFVADKNGKTNISFNGKVFTLTEPKKATTTKSGSTSTKSDNNGKISASKSGTTFGVSKQYTETIKNKDGSYIKRSYIINQKGKQPIKDVLYNKSNVKLEETNFVISNLTQTAVKSDVTKFTNGLKTVSEEYNTTTGRLEKRKDFDSAGNVTTEKTYYQPSGRVKTESKFDKNGKIIERITYVDQDKPNPSISSTTNFFASGIKTNNSVPKVDISDLIINQNKSKVEYFDKTGKPVSTEKFDTKERLIEKISYNAKAKVKTTATRTYSTPTSATGYTESIKNGKNKLVSQTRVTGSLKQVTNYDVATGKRANFANYNASGKMTSRVHYDENGQKVIERQVLQNNGRYVTTHYDTNGKVIDKTDEFTTKEKILYIAMKIAGDEQALVDLGLSGYSTLSNIKAAVLEVWDELKDLWSGIKNQSWSEIKDSLGDLFDIIKDKISKWIDGLVDNIVEFFTGEEDDSNLAYGGEITSQFLSASIKDHFDNVNGTTYGHCTKKSFSQLSKVDQEYWANEINQNYDENGNLSDGIEDVTKLGYVAQDLNYFTFPNNSDLVTTMLNNNDVQDRLRHLIKYNISESSFDFKDKTLPNYNTDLHYALGEVKIKNLTRLSDGRVTFEFTDTYDFSSNADGLSKCGVALQESGKSKPFVMIAKVTLSASEVRKLLNGTKNCYIER